MVPISTLSGSILYGTTLFGSADSNATIFALHLMPGDANNDGRVDINDLTIVLINFGRTGMTWSQGEFTGDGNVDINDLTIVLAHFGQFAAAGPAAVPEPSTFVLLSIGAFVLLLFRRTGRA